MAPTDQETEVVLPAEEPEEMPLPSDPKVIFLGGLFVLALLATAYVASEIVLPLIFAVVLNLLLQPALRILERLHVPRILAALLLILALFEAQCHGCAAHELGSGDGVCARKQGHLVTESDQFIREIGNNRSVPP